MIDFIGRIFSPITGVLGSALEYFHLNLGLPWWLAIVLLTIVVRSVLFPLTVKQVRNMRSMQELKPDLEKIKAKFPNNRQKQQEETMALYQERKINPLGGCLPLLVQIPIFIGIFYVIKDFGGFSGALGGGGATEASHPSFTEGGILWFTNLSNADQFYILPVVAAITMLASMEVTNKSMEPQQRWIMRIMPVGFIFFTYWFPAGMFVYWITSNLVTLIQNLLIYNLGPGKKPVEPSNKAKVQTGTVAATSGEKHRGKDVEQVSSGPQQNGQPAARAKRKRRKKKK